MTTLETINPATGKRIKRYELMKRDAYHAIIDKTQSAYLSWRQTSFAERAAKLQQAAAVLRDNKQQYADIITQEMGKPITAALSEIEKCAWVCQHYAEQGEAYLAPRTIKTEMQKSYVSYQPLGIVFAIMPWNFPFWQVFRFAAPTVMAGNAALLKHAEISTGAALAIEEIFQQAGFPEHLFRSLLLDNDAAADVIAHNNITAVTLTGSDRAGRAVGAASAKALKRVVLELGGSDPYLILPDADIALAAEACVTSRLNNCGQVCIAAKRIITTPHIQQAFTQQIVDKAKHYRMGDPSDTQCLLGPMARHDLREALHQQVAKSIEQGATCLMGGFVPDGPGAYYPVTILADVKPGMPAYDEELFGPVICLLHARDEATAITMANDSAFGLAAAIFTRDVARGEKIARESIEAGSVAVNTFVASDPRLPFGGIKQSGYGRELSAEGIRSFTNSKTVIVR